jgi:hypothetical protein
VAEMKIVELLIFITTLRPFLKYFLSGVNKHGKA